MLIHSVIESSGDNMRHCDVIGPGKGKGSFPFSADMGLNIAGIRAAHPARAAFAEVARLDQNGAVPSAGMFNRLEREASCLRSQQRIQ